jgi:antitoxin component YwqK of YwqJK toxin-antitoxin module
MYSRLIIILFLVVVNFSCPAQSQEKLNVTDQKGLKQGHWIKKNPNGHTVYDGWFTDNKPTGTFKRYYDNDTIQSVLVYSNDGTRAAATFYHTNGFIESKGNYINQKREGKWQFYSALSNGYLISEEEYSGNKKNGQSVKYYRNKSLSEKLFYKNDIKTGQWSQFYPNGQECLKANYTEGKLEGKFEVFFDNGKPEFTGQYRNDARDGTWLRYNRDGSVKNRINYVAGHPTNPELYKEETEYLDMLEKNKGKIADPEKTGSLW